MLSDDQIDRLMNPRKPYSSAKAIERAVRKEEEALIRQMLDAIEAEMSPSWECNSYHPSLYRAITAARARLAAHGITPSAAAPRS